MPIWPDLDAAGQQYQPSNGSEGEYFHEKWCARCARDKDMNGTCYAEGRDPGLEERNSRPTNRGPLQQLREHFEPCFDHAHPKIFQACKPKQLQWHFGDPRDLSSWTLESRYWEAFISAVVLAVDDRRKTNILLAGMQGSAELLEQAREFLMAIASLDSARIAKVMFDPNLANVSLIRRQIAKSPLRSQWENNWMQSYFDVSFELEFGDPENSAQKLHKRLQKALPKYFSQLEEAIQGQKKFEGPMLHHELRDFLIGLISPIMDLYTLSRITKSQAPHFVIIYVGDSHVKQMKHFLIKTGWCTLVEEVQETDVVRSKKEKDSDEESSESSDEESSDDDSEDIEWDFDGSQRCLHFKSEINVEDLASEARSNMSLL